MSVPVVNQKSPEIEKVTLKVPPYVALYLAKEYGPGPYNLAQSSDFKDLQTSFLYHSLLMQISPPMIVTPESLINLDLLISTKSVKYQATAQIIRSVPTYYSFFYLEFWQALISFIRGQQFFKGVSRRDAVKNFLEYYEIPEDVLSFDSTLRSLTRFLGKRTYRSPSDCHQNF